MKNNTGAAGAAERKYELSRVYHLGVSRCLNVSRLLRHNRSVQTVTKTHKLCDRRLLRIEICVRVTHGYDDSRTPKQLLDCHNIHASFNEARRERVTGELLIRA